MTTRAVLERAPRPTDPAQRDQGSPRGVARPRITRTSGRGRIPSGPPAGSLLGRARDRQRRGPRGCGRQTLNRDEHTIGPSCGALPLHPGLAAQRIHLGRKRVARLMLAARLQGVSPHTTTRGSSGSAGPTISCSVYVPTRPGFLYLVVLLDAWSRRAVDWAMATHQRTATRGGGTGHGHRPIWPHDARHRVAKGRQLVANPLAVHSPRSPVRSTSRPSLPHV